ncbi:MAG: NADP-dependent isocitrate dehydrogenase [Pirellulaceae bacterium]|nr:NADP-dependent isocitrate dehydrogenase [Pirellulaceae bacterium]
MFVYSFARFFVACDAFGLEINPQYATIACELATKPSNESQGIAVNALKIVYTKTDEAPALATRSLLPIVSHFVEAAGIAVELVDISLAGRILAAFPDYLDESQRRSDGLAQLGELVKSPDANIIKLPNVSASIPQLNAAISELQLKGFSIPDFPDVPSNSDEELIRKRYAKILGSAVNPVLREGNSDRRVASPVKQYAKNNPHSMGPWSRDSMTHVSHMQHGDFNGSERSHVMSAPGTVRIEFTADGAKTEVMKQVDLRAGEIIDASVMNRIALRDFYAREIADAKQQGLLLSLHLKATMMKISDPVIFGHALSVYFDKVLQKWGKELDSVGFNPNNGLADLLKRIESLPSEQQAAIKASLEEVYQQGPSLAMVDSDRGITNFHVPSDVIVDASMPAMIRSSGKMWGRDGKLHDTKALIPDRCYASLYQETIKFCKEHGAFDPATIGSVSNVGLMVLQAEEYGSHDKTFVIQQPGTMRVVDESGKTLIEHPVHEGDIWRMCQTKDEAIRDWVALAVARVVASGSPAVFWLDDNRSHDRCVTEKVVEYLKSHNSGDHEIQIMSPSVATRFTCQRAKDGLDTISVTGNVLRDYLTDLFPILELGTSAKMLSIVPMLAGGGMYETGAGGSAPKHVQQFVAEGHLRWDSLGEFLAIAASLEDLSNKTGNKQAKLLAKTLDQASSKLLSNDKSPSRNVGELDNRGSHFYLALYWAQALSDQSENEPIQKQFHAIANQLQSNEAAIIGELKAVQGKPVDIGGYYFPDETLANEAMRPSATMNKVFE